MIEKIKSRAMWQPLVEKYQSSGLSKQAFCTQEGVNVNTFKGWCSKLLKKSDDADSVSSNWLTVVVKGKRKIEFFVKPALSSKVVSD